MYKKAEILRGPFDPGGQPDTSTRQPLELGFFAWNIKGGLTMSKAVLTDPDRYTDYWRWPIASRLVQLAEQVGFDYEVQFARWIGQGGATNFNDANIDFASGAAAIAPLTKTIALFSSAHVTYKFHPLHLAKIGACIDHISDGRWALNIVTGINPRDHAAFGNKEGIPHDEAYAIADEFTTLMKYLWTEQEPIDFEGKYYQAYGAVIEPKPTRWPRPILMNAGNSPVGLDFACRQTDWVFITAPTLEAYEARIEEVHRKAAAYGRKVRAATMVYVIMASTDSEAKAIVDWVAEEVDREAVRSWMTPMIKEGSYAKDFNVGAASEASGDPWLGIGKEKFLRLALGMGAWQLFGSYPTVAEQIRELHNLGLESILLCFLDPLRGLHQMEDDVIPLLKKMGLRR